MSDRPTIGECTSAALGAPELSPIEKAAGGDPVALQEMAHFHVAAANEVADSPARLARLSEALTFARLACAHGAKDGSQLAVTLYGEIAMLLRQAGDTDAGDMYEAQGFLLAEFLAENGDSEMADHVVKVAEAVSPGAHRYAAMAREAA